MTNVQGLAHIAIIAENYQKTIRCYTELFSFTIGHHWRLDEYQIKDASMLVSPDGKTCIEVFDRFAQVPSEGTLAKTRVEILHGSLLHFAFYVKDVVKIITDAQEWGLRITSPLEKLSLGTPPLFIQNAIIEGPNGEMIEVIQEVDFNVSQ